MILKVPNMDTLFIYLESTNISRHLRWQSRLLVTESDLRSHCCSRFYTLSADLFDSTPVCKQTHVQIDHLRHFVVFYVLILKTAKLIKMLE